MIAKNEAVNLNEMLPAAAPHVSGWFVCDTGSTDGTPELVKSFFKRRNTPGEVAHHQWRDFSYNRNLCLREGLRIMKNKCKYWLILDADQIFVSEAGTALTAMPLKKDAYWVEERSHGSTFHNMRLVNTAVEWRYEGAIHEHIRPVGGRSVLTGTLPSTMYTLHDNTYDRGFENDAAILERELTDDPLNPRNNFYLGNAYSMLNRRADAVRQYMKRLALSGSNEEAYISALTIAKNLYSWFTGLVELDEQTIAVLKELKLMESSEPSFEEVEAAFKKAGDVLPYRKEAWYHLAHLHWTQQGDADTCYKYALKAQIAGPHTFRTLFSDIKIVEYMVYDQMCTCAYPAGEFLDGFKACDTLQTKLLALGSNLESWQQEMLAVTKIALQQFSVFHNRGEKLVIDNKGFIKPKTGWH